MDVGDQGDAVKRARHRAIVARASLRRVRIPCVGPSWHVPVRVTSIFRGTLYRATI
jgi:hypothetical protein